MSCKARLPWVLVLACMFVFSGCVSSSAKDDKKVGKTPDEIKKANLLKKIDRKFENPEAHYELGRMYQADRMWSEAEHHYSLALNFEPAHWYAQAARVKVLGEAGDKSKAALLNEIYVDQASNSAAASLKLGLGFQKQELDDDALRCYQQALRLAPNSSRINRQIGYYYLAKGDKVRAQDYFVRSFQLNADQGDVAYQLGLLGRKVAPPRKKQKNTKKLDKIVDDADKADKEARGG